MSRAFSKWQEAETKLIQSLSKEDRDDLIDYGRAVFTSEAALAKFEKGLRGSQFDDRQLDFGEVAEETFQAWSAVVYGESLRIREVKPGKTDVAGRLALLQRTWRSL
jgi:hypothetical protein